MCKVCGNCTIDHIKSFDDFIDEADGTEWQNSQIKNG